MSLANLGRRAVCAFLALTPFAASAGAQTTYPAIPEPMIFDMMRPLGAQRGELEANILAVSNEPFRPRHAEWAPEVEYAFADGKAVEIELPFDGDRLAAFKLGLQGALGASADGRTAHGVQYLGIYDRAARRYSSALLYMNGHRFSRRWSMMAMAGLDDIALTGVKRDDAPVEGNGRNALLLNHATFYDLRDGAVIGAELNVVRGARRHVRLSPQWHQRIGHGVNVQLAAGVEKDRGRAMRPTTGVRLIREF